MDWALVLGCSLGPHRSPDCIHLYPFRLPRRLREAGRVPSVTQLLGWKSRASDPKPSAFPLPIIPVGCGKATVHCGGQQGLPSNVTCKVLALR